MLATRWREHEQARVTAITSDPDPARQASLLRDELLRVIDAKVTLEHEMEALRHQLIRSSERSDELDSQLTGVRTVPHPPTELAGRPQPAVRRTGAAESDPASPAG
jgi:uncharacterized protein with von Willebrand factor type A (vWA) domain